MSSGTKARKRSSSDPGIEDNKRTNSFCFICTLGMAGMQSEESIATTGVYKRARDIIRHGGEQSCMCY